MLARFCHRCRHDVVTDFWGVSSDDAAVTIIYGIWGLGGGRCMRGCGCAVGRVHII